MFGLIILFDYSKTVFKVFELANFISQGVDEITFIFQMLTQMPVKLWERAYVIVVKRGICSKYLYAVSGGHAPCFSGK